MISKSEMMITSLKVECILSIQYVCTGITLRFGYWQKVDLDGLKKILPDWCDITVNTMDDDDCGTLYNYNITDSSKYYAHNQVD